MYAIVNLAGCQFRVEPDESLLVPRLPGVAGDTVSLEEVLLVSREGQVTVGRPTVAGARVEVEILSQERGPKVRVFKMKRRKKYRRLRGHRQPLTRVRVVTLEGGVGESTAAAEPAS